MTANDQELKPQSPERRLKLAAAAVPVFAAVAYPIGFLLLNVVYSIWGFTDFHILRAQCFFIVLWTVMMMVGWSLPVLLLLSIEGKLSNWLRSLINRKSAIGVLSLVLAVVALGVAWLARHPDVIRSLVLYHLEFIDFLIISGMGASALFFPVGLIQDQKHKRLADIRLSEWLGGIMGIVFATIFFSATFLFTPASWGGGIPSSKPIWSRPRQSLIWPPTTGALRSPQRNLRNVLPGANLSSIRSKVFPCSTKAATV